MAGRHAPYGGPAFRPVLMEGLCILWPPTWGASVFEYLASNRRIVVTGPQRSGTTIAGKMVAHDTGHRYVDEMVFSVYDVAAWREVLGGDGIVVQCPHMLKVILDDPPPGIFVILMRRDLDDIHASERRIEWERRFKGNTRELAMLGHSQGDSARLKYEYWDSSPKPARFMELCYESLAGHPLYIAQEQRADFDCKQTTASRRDPRVSVPRGMPGPAARPVRPRSVGGWPPG